MYVKTAIYLNVTGIFFEPVANDRRPKVTFKCTFIFRVFVVDFS